MPTADLVMVVVKLSVGAITTFLAILLWANTRDTAWMLIVIGVVVEYAQIMYRTFETFGILPAAPSFFGIPLTGIVVDNLPMVLFGFGFIVVLSRGRLH